MLRLTSVGVLSLVLAACSPLCDEQFERGVYIPSGDAMNALGDGRGDLYSMAGSERVSDTELRDLALVHVVILYSSAEVKGSVNRFENDCLRGTHVLTWQLHNGTQQQLEIEYDGKQKTVRIGSDRFPAWRENCFVVRVDSAWHVTTAALPLRVTEDGSPESLLARIRSATRDADLQTLRSYDEATRKTAA